MEEPTAYQLTVLNALQHKPLYLGSAAPQRVAKRRAANKVARKQRRVNRQRG